MSDVIIYTCITNKKDKLREYVPEEGVRYICFTNCELEQKSKQWEILPLKYQETDMRRTARFHKVNPHIVLPDHEWSVWMDGNIKPMVRQNEIIEWMGNKHFGAMIHGLKRRCLYDEMDAVIERKKESSVIVKRVFERYKDEGVPKNITIHATGALVRRNMEAVRNFGELWWEEIRFYSKRDQLSFDYLRWKHNFDVVDLKTDWYQIDQHEYKDTHEEDNSK